MRTIINRARFARRARGAANRAATARGGQSSNS